MKGSEVSNGFLNRFLLVAVRRSKRLPSGGNIFVLEPFIGSLKEAIAKASSLGVVKRTPKAEREWAHWDCALPEREGVVGKVTARAEAHALRLSLIFALADGSDVIGVQHLRAGLAVWEYCERGAVEMFGKAGEGTTTSLPSLSEKLLQAIMMKPGILRTELWDVAGHKVKAEELDTALTGLEAFGSIFKRVEGRGERWYPVEGGRVEEPPVRNDIQTATNEVPPSTIPPENFVEELAASRPATAGHEPEGEEVVVQPEGEEEDYFHELEAM